MAKLLDAQEWSVWNDRAFMTGGGIGLVLGIAYEMSEAAMNEIDEIEPFLEVVLEIGVAFVLAACLSKVVAVCGQRILKWGFERKYEKAAS